MKIIHKGENGTKISLEDGVIRKIGSKVEKEFDILSRLDHPNIVKVFKCGHTIEGYKFIEMEYFEGDPLICPTQQQLDELSDAIKYIHAQGVKHNDLMGYNILSDGTTIKIIDFGNADTVCRRAKDVEGCEREDWENYGIFEVEKYVTDRKNNNNTARGEQNG